MADADEVTEDLNQWRTDHEKALSEWCEAQSEWCREMHGRMSDLEAIIARMGIIAGVADKPQLPPPPRPPSG